MLEFYLISDSQNIMVVLSYEFPGKKEKHSLVSVFCQNVIWGALLFIVLMGWPNDGNFGIALWDQDGNL